MRRLIQAFRENVLNDNAPDSMRFLVQRRAGMRRGVQILAVLLLVVSMFSATSYTAGPFHAGVMAPFMIVGALIAGAGLLPSRLLRRRLFTLDLLGFIISIDLVITAYAYAFQLPSTAPFMIPLVALVTVIGALFLFWTPLFHALWLATTGLLGVVAVLLIPTVGLGGIFLLVTAIVMSWLGHRFAWDAWLRRFSDATRIRDLNQSLSVAVRIDPTTQVGNRRAMDEAFARVARGQIRHWSVLIIDIDHFKGVNDTEGHLEGDSAITRVAEIIRGAVRTNDLVFRYGGDEFLVLLPEASEEAAYDVGERLRGTVEAAQIRNAGAPSKLLTVSVGAATSTASTDENGPVPILRVADDALYAAKRNGRNKVSGSFAEGTAATI